MPECEYCGDELSSDISLMRHKRNFHRRELDYECPSCDTRFETKNGMNQHHTKVHGESIAKETRNCKWCNVEFEIYTSHLEQDDYQGEFCSHECSREWLSENFNGEDHPNYKGNRVEIVCDNCSEDFEVWKHQEDKLRFCCRECYDEFRSENWTGENHPLWKDNDRIPMGENWREQREKTLERDGYQCRVCGLSQSQSLAKYGKELDVHHIKKRREYYDEGKKELDWERANRLDNLITLCSTHHRLVETKRIDCPDPQKLEENPIGKNVLNF